MRSAFSCIFDDVNAQEYTNYWGNIADIVILLFSLMALFVFLFGSLYFEIIGAAFTIVLACFRWMTLFLRIVVTIKKYAVPRPLLTSSQTVKFTADKIGMLLVYCLLVYAVEIDTSRETAVEEDSDQMAIESENIFDNGFDFTNPEQSGTPNISLSSSQNASPTFLSPSTKSRENQQRQQQQQQMLQQGVRIIGGTSRKGLNNIIIEDSQFSFNSSPSNAFLSSPNTNVRSAVQGAGKKLMSGKNPGQYQSIQSMVKTVNSVGHDVHHFESNSYS